ncbi:MAG: hypothetical protein HYZ65_03325 [Burkholderiales bacterium]|nr:hypothetical protein [Burkholderiales bacterium]
MAQYTWRFLIACLMLVLLPLQGMAATGMLVCGPGHQRQAGQATQGCHEMHAAAQDEASLRSHHTSSDMDDGAAHASHGKCNAGAACCSATALLTSFTLHLAAPVSADVFVIPATLHTSAPVRTLERPPRHFLA